MSDRSLRGMRLGAQSMETESGVEPAPRQRVEYRCEDGEQVFVTSDDGTRVPLFLTHRRDVRPRGRGADQLVRGGRRALGPDPLEAQCAGRREETEGQCHGGPGTVQGAAPRA